MVLLRAIAGGDRATVLDMIAGAPSLATARIARGATRQDATAHYLADIEHYVYAGDSALHISAAGYRPDFARALIAAGSDVRARNRRGAEPLHYAADGNPNFAPWRPEAQAATVAYLIAAGADPNAVDNSGVTALHRAVRTRCAAAVRALLDGGADARLTNKSGSTPLKLALQNTGRGGTGSARSKAQQEEIVRLLVSQAATG
jgi:hypothetical protein